MAKDAAKWHTPSGSDLDNAVKGPRFLCYRDQRWPVVIYEYATRLLRQVMSPENRRLIASAKGEGPTEAT